jgi:hypothetical protein
MRALDPIVTADNIRIAAIHPWFAGMCRTALPPMMARRADSTLRYFRHEDTSILGLPVKLLLAGIPLTPVPRIAGAIFRAATDPDLATSGCPWVLPDDGPVIRVEKEALRAGVYEMLTNRIRRATKYVPFCLSVSAGADSGPSLQLCYGRRRLGALDPRFDTYLPPCADRPCPYCCARRCRVEGNRHHSPLKVSLLNVHARYILQPPEKNLS